MPRRVLIFSLAYHPLVGGAEIAVKEITDRLPDLEFDMVTIRPSDDVPKFEHIGNVNVHRVGSSSSYVNKILFVPRAALFAMRRKYDLWWGLMTYMLFPIAIARILGKRTPYVLTLQDGDPFERVFTRARIFPFVPLLLYGFRHAAKVQAISNFLAEWAYKMGYKGEVEIIPNGVDTERFKIQDSGFKNNNETVIITTSRLVEKNGIGDVIEAMQYLPDNVKFWILGSGSLEIDLKLKIENWKLEERVKMLGYVEQKDIPSYLRRADIFIRPSLSEGFGSSFIEAMAAGLPVIATPVGGIVDFVTDGKTGYFCEPKNPQNIADTVGRVMTDQNRDQVIAAAAQMAREKYDWNLITSEMKRRVFDTAVKI